MHHPRSATLRRYAILLGAPSSFLAGQSLAQDSKAQTTPAAAPAAAVTFATGAVSDAGGGPRAGFVLATGLAALPFVGLLLNWLLQPARARLQALEASEYAAT